MVCARGGLSKLQNIPKSGNRLRTYFPKTDQPATALFSKRSEVHSNCQLTCSKRSASPVSTTEFLRSRIVLTIESTACCPAAVPSPADASSEPVRVSVLDKLDEVAQDSSRENLKPHHSLASATLMSSRRWDDPTSSLAVENGNATSALRRTRTSRTFSQVGTVGRAETVHGAE